MASTIPFIHIGLGPIGREVLNITRQRPNLKLVGVVDIDPQKIGKDLGEVLGGDKMGITVSGSISDAVSREKPLIAIHTTRSHIPEVKDQLIELAEQGINVISSTEELLFPFVKYPKESEELNKAAQEGNCSILGTGVNPGFVMDTLPVVLTGVCRSVHSLKIERIVDAARRREPLQRKVGAGLTTARFRELADAGKLGHVGLRESLYLVAHALNWELDKIEETLDPVVSEQDIQTEYLRVLSGQVAGIRHRCRGFRNGEVKLELDLQMYVGAPQPHDRVVIDGDPPVDCMLQNGIFGDTATAAILVNLVPNVVAALPGLKTMLDISIPRFSGMA